MKNENRELSLEMRDKLLKTLKQRFELNMERHKDIEWEIIENRLVADTKKLWSLNEMERTVVSRMLSVMMKIAMNIYFMTVPQKALTAAETYVTIVKPRSQGK